MSTNTRANTLEGLLARRPGLAKRVRERAGLAEIASLLLELRHELKLSQKELAKRSGVPKTLISELENAANDGVTLRTLVKIARGAGASLNLAFRICADAVNAGTVTSSLDVRSYCFSPADTQSELRLSEAVVGEAPELAA